MANKIHPDDRKRLIWLHFAGPIILDVIAIICTTILVATKNLEVDAFKYLIGVLVVGNLALRVPGINKIPPSGGGFIVAFLSSIVATFKGFKS